jgi:hypothetical protein
MPSAPSVMMRRSRQAHLCAVALKGQQGADTARCLHWSSCRPMLDAAQDGLMERRTLDDDDLAALAPLVGSIADRVALVSWMGQRGFER